MWLSDADSSVSFALPVFSSGASLRARLFARIVPPMPPPTIKIFIRVSLFRLADRDVPHPRLLAGAKELVSDLLHPFGYVARRSLVGRQDFQLVADVGELDPSDQLHERARAEAAAGVDDLVFAHAGDSLRWIKRRLRRALQNVTSVPSNASARKRVRPSGSASQSSS